MFNMFITRSKSGTADMVWPRHAARQPMQNRSMQWRSKSKSADRQAWMKASAYSALKSLDDYNTHGTYYCGNTNMTMF